MADDRNSVSAGAGSKAERGAPVAGESSSLNSASNNNNGNGDYINGEHGAVMQVEAELPGEPSSGWSGQASDLTNQERPLILIDDSNCSPRFGRRHRRDNDEDARSESLSRSNSEPDDSCPEEEDRAEGLNDKARKEEAEEEQVEEIDGISYRIVAAVTKPAARKTADRRRQRGLAGSELDQAAGMADQASSLARKLQVSDHKRDTPKEVAGQTSAKQTKAAGGARLLSSMRRKSSAFVTNLLLTANQSQHHSSKDGAIQPRRRQSIYEMTKSPPPETSLEIYLSDRRRSSTVSAKQIQQQLEQQSTFETNYCQRQQYFKDLNQKLINQDKKLLNVVANRGQIHRHSVDIAQLPLHSAQANALLAAAAGAGSNSSSFKSTVVEEGNIGELAISRLKHSATDRVAPALAEDEILKQAGDSFTAPIDQSRLSELDDDSGGIIGQPLSGRLAAARRASNRLLLGE